MNTDKRIPRRTVLKGLGTAMALPFFESMSPAWASPGRPEVEAPPNRMAFFYVPNGVHMPDWTPLKEGAEYRLPATLEPLAPYREKLNVLSGLTLDKARANGDGPGDHARSVAAFLTGVQPYKTNGADIRAGMSIDQIAAEKVGDRTRFASIELGCERGAQSGNCDSGYSCAYSSNLSWRSESTPMLKEINPKLVFERLFSTHRAGETAESRGKRDLYDKSILDFVLDDAARLKGKLGRTDRRKLDEYLTSVREVERRIEYSGKAATGELNGIEAPAGVPEDYGEHVRLMFDCLLLAFQTDVTRIATFMYANAGSNRSYRSIDVPEGHHDLSHHGGDRNKHIKIAKINQFHIEQFAYLLEKMSTIQEGDGTLLDHVMLVYGSGIGDGNRHNHDDLPVLLAGKGGGTIQSGRHIRYPKDTPLTNLYVSMLDRIDASAEAVGDSTGSLARLDG